MATYVQIINRVLRRLREDEVSNYDDTVYSTLIGDFVNETISEMQEKVEWNALLDDHTVTLDGSTRVYALTSSTGSRDTNDQSRIIRVFDDTNDWHLIQANYQWVTTAKLDAPDPDNTSYYRSKGVDSTGRRQVEFYPDVAATVNVATYNPHSELSTSSAQVLLPSRIVMLGAYARAIHERGEDGGVESGAAWRMYASASGAAVVNELNRSTDDESVWEIQ